ncbi:DUF6542 domain-containing protein [Streptomyces coeruleorubidus]|uniref:DUF6542 domain-containing protein n=1 Tax=Streptomyces coeruleorubidus TaxID=116188 RepID=A0A5J6IFW1_STRC4|nr:DUF6542 domain-containing protein [Streptomyces coeruleorubidus]QEV27575.1 hypothetical protein CP976_27980 [Streptomyces coeruleorubidus]
MERYRTRPAQYGPRRDRPRSSLPPQAGRGADGGAVRAVRQPGPQRRPAAVRRPAPAPAPALARMPNPRLTGLGSGLFCALVMFLIGGLCAVLFGASLTAYGVLFLPVCVLTAVWVRRGDLMTAPVVVPIAFAVGLLPVADGDGTGGMLMGLVTALATHAGWLYGGTLVAGLIVIVRRIRLVHRRRAAAGTRPQV